MEGERRNVRSIEIDQPIEVKFLDNSNHDVVLYAEKHALDQLDKVRRSGDSGSGGAEADAGKSKEAGDDSSGGTVEVVESMEEGNDKRVKRKVQTKRVVSEDPRTNSRITTVTKTETTEVTKVYVLKTDKDLQDARLELGAAISDEDLVPGRRSNLRSEWSRPRFIGGGPVVHHRRSSPCLLSKCLRRRSVHEPVLRVEDDRLYRGSELSATGSTRRGFHPADGGSRSPRLLDDDGYYYYEGEDEFHRSRDPYDHREPRRFRDQRPMSVYDRPASRAVKAESPGSPCRLSNLCRCTRSRKAKKETSQPPRLRRERSSEEPTHSTKSTKAASAAAAAVLVATPPTKKQAKHSLSDAVQGKLHHLKHHHHPKYQPLIDDSQKDVVRQNNLQLSTYLFDLIDRVKGFKNEEEAHRARKMIARSLDLLQYDRCDSWPDYKDQMWAENIEYPNAENLIGPVSNLVEHVFTEFDTGDKLTALMDSIPSDKLIRDAEVAANAPPVRRPTSSPVHPRSSDEEAAAGSHPHRSHHVKDFPKVPRKLSSSADAVGRDKTPREGAHDDDDDDDKLSRPISAKDIAIAAGGAIGGPVAYVASIIKDHHRHPDSSAAPSEQHPRKDERAMAPTKRFPEHRQPEHVSEIIAEAMEGTPRLLTDSSIPERPFPEVDAAGHIRKPKFRFRKPKGFEAPTHVDLDLDSRPSSDADARKPRSKRTPSRERDGASDHDDEHRDRSPRNRICVPCGPRRRRSKEKVKPTREEEPKPAEAKEKQPSSASHIKCAPCFPSRRSSKHKDDDGDHHHHHEPEEPIKKPKKKSSDRKCIMCFGDKSQKTKGHPSDEYPKRKTSRTSSLEPPSVHLPEIDASSNMSGLSTTPWKRFSVGESAGKRPFDLSRPLLGNVTADVSEIVPAEVELSQPMMKQDRDSVWVEQEGRIHQVGADPDDYVNIHRSEHIDVSPGGKSHQTTPIQVTHSPGDGLSKPASVQFKVRRGEPGSAYSTKLHQDEPPSDYGTASREPSSERTGHRPSFSLFSRKKDKQHPDQEGSDKEGGKRDESTEGRDPSSSSGGKHHKGPLLPWFGGGRHPSKDTSDGEDDSEPKAGPKSRESSVSSGKRKPWFSRSKDDAKKDEPEEKSAEKKVGELKRIIEFHKGMARPHGDLGDFYMHPDEEGHGDHDSDNRPDRLGALLSDRGEVPKFEGLRKMIDDHKAEGLGIATGAAVVAGIIDEHKKKRQPPSGDVDRGVSDRPSSKDSKEPEGKPTEPSSGEVPTAGEKEKRGKSPTTTTTSKPYHMQPPYLSEPLVGDFGPKDVLRTPSVPVIQPISADFPKTDDDRQYEPRRYDEGPVRGSGGDYRGEPLHRPVEISAGGNVRGLPPYMKYPQSGVASIMAEHKNPGALIGQEARFRRSGSGAAAASPVQHDHHHPGNKCLTCFGSKSGDAKKNKDAEAPKSKHRSKRGDKSPHRIASIIHDVKPVDSEKDKKHPGSRLPEIGAAAAVAATAADKRAAKKRQRSKEPRDRSEPVEMRETHGEHRRSRCFSCGRPSERSASPLVLSPECINLLDFLQKQQPDRLDKRLGDRLVNAYPAENKSEINKIVKKALNRLRNGSVPTLSVLRNQLKNEHPKSAHLVDPIVDAIASLPLVAPEGLSAGGLDDPRLSSVIEDAKRRNPPPARLNVRHVHWPDLIRSTERRLLGDADKEKKQKKKMAKIIKDAESILKKTPSCDLNELRSKLYDLHPKDGDIVDMVVEDLANNLPGPGFDLRSPVKILINITHGGDPRIDTSAPMSALLSQRADLNLRRNHDQLKKVIVEVLCEHEKRPQLSSAEIEALVDKAFNHLPSAKSFDEVTDRLKADYSDQSLHPLISSICNLIEQAYFANEFDSLDEKAKSLLRDRLAGKPLVLREISFSLPPNTSVCCGCCCCCCNCGSGGGAVRIGGASRFCGHPTSGVQAATHPCVDFTLTTDQDTERQYFSSSSYMGPSRSVSLGRGLTWREANERARVLFYRGKQPAVRYNSSLHGFDVRMLLEQDGHIQEIPVSQPDVIRLLDSCGLHWDGNQISMMSAEDSDKILKRAEEEAFKILRETGFMRPHDAK